MQRSDIFHFFIFFLLSFVLFCSKNFTIYL